MAISFVGGTTAASNSVSIPPHQAGDLLLIAAYNPFSSSASTSAGWTQVATSALGSSATVLYKVATSTQVAYTSSGSFSNAYLLVVAIYRGANAVFLSSSSAAFGSVLSYPALAGATVDGRDIRIGAHRFATNLGTAFSGYSLRGSVINTGQVVLQDALITGSNLSSQTQAANAGGEAHAFTLSIAPSATVLLASGAFTAGLSAANFSLTVGTINATRRRYDVSAYDANLFFTRLLVASSGGFGLAGANPFTNYTFALLTTSGGFSAQLNGDLKRHLVLRTSTRSFALTRASATLPKGYIIFGVAQTFGTSGAAIDLFHAAYIGGVSTDYVLDEGPNNFFQRHLFFRLISGAIQQTLLDVGLANNQDGFRPAGMAPRPPESPQGGSEPSYPSFIRPKYVRFNSVSKARDLGLVNNIFTQFAGQIGSQVGTNTIFFKITTTGPADLRIKKNPLNRFTDGYLSVGILDEDRKPVPQTNTGFAYQNEVVNTDVSEFENYVPGGVYYFTLSSSQWQALDFSIDVQVIRFRELGGVATWELEPYGRFPFAKMRGSADLAAPFVAIIPRDDAVIKLSGRVDLDSDGRGTLTIMQGAALLTMSPRGRLLTNHKLVGAVTMSDASRGTLTATAPYGY